VVGGEAPKYFAAVEIEERAGNPEWLSTATKVIAKHWAGKNERRKVLLALRCSSHVFLMLVTAN
jgi:hypothetical protein